MPLAPQWLEDESTGSRREKLQDCAGLAGSEVNFKVII